jgi:hypothetical protein
MMSLLLRPIPKPCEGLITIPVTIGRTTVADDQASLSARAKPSRKITESVPAAVERVPATATVVSAHFKMIFLAVFFLTVALLVTRITVAIMVRNPSDSLKDAMATCNLLAIAGFGAMLGLIGGKII